jgi:[ribosomal protein S5]-alanine N-acetyltransferase
MSFFLLQLTDPQLEELAASRSPGKLSERAEPEALPPAFVAARSLRLRAEGQPEPWSTSFLIVRNLDKRIVGSCGFKTAPKSGRVEVGYGVSPTARGEGAATEALRLLVTKAFEVGTQTVLAEVAPDNLASTKVVKKCGFIVAGAQHDTSGEYVIQWLLSRAA